MNGFSLFLLLYNLLYLLFSPLIFLYLFSRKDSRERLRDYCGLHRNISDNTLKILVHGVSVGEVLSAIPLIKTLKKEFHATVILSTTIDDAIKISSNFDELFTERVFLPLDFGPFMERFLTAINPSVVIISETDFWPNMLYICQKRKIPLYLSNGRISQKLGTGFQTLKPVSSLLLNSFSKFFVQRTTDRERLMDSGVPSGKIIVAGNAKYESVLQIEPPSPDTEQILDFLDTYEGNYFIGGSTHPDEEDLILSFIENATAVNVKAIIAPRIVSRAPQIQEMVIKKGLSPCLFSKLKEHLSKDASDEETGEPELSFDVLIVDVLGELKYLYAVKGIVFIGGTFSTVGGHNFLEAAIHKKAIIAGPDFHNFSEDLSRFLDESAIVQVATRGEFLLKATELLTTNSGKKTGERAFNLLVKSQGAVKNTSQIIIEELSGIWPREHSPHCGEENPNA